MLGNNIFSLVCFTVDESSLDVPLIRVQGVGAVICAHAWREKRASVKRSKAAACAYAMKDFRRLLVSISPPTLWCYLWKAPCYTWVRNFTTSTLLLIIWAYKWSQASITSLPALPSRTNSHITSLIFRLLYYRLISMSHGMLDPFCIALLLNNVHVSAMS